MSDRPQNFKLEGAVGFVRLLPLSEIIAVVLGLDSPSAQQVWNIYNLLIKAFENEYNVLLDVPKEALVSVVNERIAEAIIKVRENRIKVMPGYDGVYGQPIIFEEQTEEKTSLRKVQQLNLTEFL